ncbi:response regulator transcription factor [Pseudomonas cremoricolorata]|uniref:LuxR family transcriptional regulator n=1 Tax=Pseudomonas cremoricolorata TaxID=157783 RepID=A0A089WQA1_9PSED|nr:response regulator transcription factor [Pseudomonas cremoricolorata]AIR89339.1 LuxR family transcriptional regulator [Pseudomonas cremoricolorata]
MSKAVSEVKVLLVDDQAPAIKAISAFLERQGYRCVAAQNAEQAVDCYQRDSAIGLVLCDLHMADADGLQLLDRLKAADTRPRLFEAILLTEQTDKQQVIHALREGFADYYQKPADLDDLLNGVRRQEQSLLERQRQVRELGSLNQRLHELAESLDELYLDLEKARGQSLQRRSTDPAEGEAELPAVFDKLSPRQLEVARLVSKGKTNFQIACELGITENTVKLYVSQVLRLTHMHNRTQLALALTPRTSPVHQRFTAH